MPLNTLKRRLPLIVKVFKYVALAMLVRWFVSTREEALFHIGVWAAASVGLWLLGWLLDRMEAE